MGPQVTRADMFRPQPAEAPRRPAVRNETEGRSFDQDLERLSRSRPSSQPSEPQEPESNEATTDEVSPAPTEKKAAAPRKRSSDRASGESTAPVQSDAAPPAITEPTAEAAPAEGKLITAVEPVAVVVPAITAEAIVDVDTIADKNQKVSDEMRAVPENGPKPAHVPEESNTVNRPALAPPSLPNQKQAGDAIDPRTQPAMDFKESDGASLIEAGAEDPDPKKPAVSAGPKPSADQGQTIEKPIQVPKPVEFAEETRAEPINPQSETKASRRPEQPDQHREVSKVLPPENRQQPVQSNALAQARDAIVQDSKTDLRNKDRVEKRPSKLDSDRSASDRPSGASITSVKSDRTPANSRDVQRPDTLPKVDIRGGKGDATATTVAKFLVTAPDSSDSTAAPSAPTQMSTTSMVQSSEVTRIRTPTHPANTVVDLLKLDAPGNESIRSAAQLLSSAKSEGNQQVTLQLDPPHLGQLRLEIRMHEQAMALRVDVENASVARLIESRLPDLRDALATHGIRVDQSEIAVKSPPAPENGGSASHNNGSGADSQTTARDDGSASWQGHGAGTTADRESGAWEDHAAYGSTAQPDENESWTAPFTGADSNGHLEYALNLVA